MNVDFAQSVIQSNVLMAKRASIWSDEFCAFITEFIQKYTMNSSILMGKLKEVINAEENGIMKKLKETNKDITDTRVAMHFLSSIYVELPKPDMSKITIQLAAFKEYSEGLDMVIPAFMSSEMFSSTFMGDIGDAVEPTVKVIKSYFQRQWLIKNNVMPELFDMLSFNEEDKTMNEFLKKHEEHMKTLGKTMNWLRLAV